MADFSGGGGAGTARTVCHAQPHELPSSSSVALYTARGGGQLAGK